MSVVPFSPICMSVLGPGVQVYQGTYPVALAEAAVPAIEMKVMMVLVDLGLEYVAKITEMFLFEL